MLTIYFNPLFGCFNFLRRKVFLLIPTDIEFLITSKDSCLVISHFFQCISLNA